MKQNKKSLKNGVSIKVKDGKRRGKGEILEKRESLQIE